MLKTPRLVLVGMIVAIGANTMDSRRVVASEGDSNLYAVAMLASAAEMDKSWGKQDESLGGSRSPTDYHRMLVEKDAEITDKLPTHEGGFQFEYLDYQSEIERYKRLKKQYSILKIHPIQSDGKILTIHVAKNWIEFKKGRLFVAISDWSDVEFRLDCKKDAFVLKSVKLGGI